MTTIKEHLKLYAQDLKFVDDLATEHTPPAPNLLVALLQDRKLARLTRMHERRLRKKHAPVSRVSRANRGLQLYARYCAWEDLYPDETLLNSTVWPEVAERLDSFLKTS